MNPQLWRWTPPWAAPPKWDCWTDHPHFNTWINSHLPTYLNDRSFAITLLRGHQKDEGVDDFFLLDSPSMAPPYTSDIPYISMFTDSLCVYLEKQGWPGLPWVWALLSMCSISQFLDCFEPLQPTLALWIQENQCCSASVCLTWLLYLFIFAVSTES